MPGWLRAIITTVITLAIMIVIFPAFGDFLASAGTGIDDFGDAVRDNLFQGWPGFGDPSRK